MTNKHLAFVIFFVALSFIIAQTQIACPTGCSACNVTGCSSCVSRYYRLKTACAPCPQNCQACRMDNSSKPMCDTCDTGYKKTPDSTMCFLCSPVCLDCDRAPENCTSCKEGTNLEIVGISNGITLKTCKRPPGCNLPCKACNGAGLCTSCVDGLFLNGTTCRPCQFPCLTCSSLAVCTSALPGFRIENNTAVKCNRNCMECNASACIRCEQGYTASGQDCNRCTPPCQTCSTSATTCLSCSPPFNLVGSSCVLCSPQCAACDAGTPNVCTKCYPPFSTIPAAGGMCFKCPDFNCRTCVQATKTRCIECNFGFLLSDAGTCSKCSQFCTQCSPSSANPNIMECNQCADKAALTADFKCIKCLQGCIKCSVLSGGLTTCTQCADGAWNNQGNCMRCRQGCKTCNNGEKCTSFADGRIQVDGNIFALRPGCRVGIVSMPQKCSQCALGYFLSSDNCKRCSKDCQICTDQNTCTSCAFRTTLQNGTCVRCNDKCLTCDASNRDICKSCPLGLTLDSNTCVSKCASKNCLECDATNTSICTKFRDGYSVNENNKMIRCLSSCGGKCNPKKPSQCLSAAFGYELINGKTSKCPQGAVSCENGKPSQCEDRYTLKQVNGVFGCVRNCRFPCSECSVDDVCSLCMPNFILDPVEKKCNPDLTCGGGTCVVCPFGSYRSNSSACVACSLANCASCSNVECFECREGFYLGNNGSGNMVCLQCAANCQRCKDDTTCDVCLNGYLREALSEDTNIQMIQFSPNCVKCTEPCKNCFLKATTCRSCIDGFRINGTSCISNITVGVTATIIGNSDTFMSDGKQSDLCTALANGTGVSENSTIPNNVVGGTRPARRLLQTDTTTTTTTISLNSGQSGSAIASLATATLTSYYGSDLISSSAALEAEDGSIVIDGTKVNVGMIVGIVIGGFVFVAILVVIIYLVCIKPKADTVFHQQLEGNVEDNSVGLDTLKVNVHPNNN